MSKHPVPSAALNQHIAILGKTGSGKTYAAKGLVERMLEEHRQVCVLDPTGAWWGLRLGADGKAKSGGGYDVVLLGGKRGDLPLSPRSGAAVARMVTQQGASAVIDTSGMSVGEYTQWFIDFAGTLYTTIKSPLQLVIDEAHYFMPQGKAPDPQAGRMIHAGNRLMSGGRSLGIRGLMITQRPAKLHKDSLTCADTLIAMRVIAPQDRAAIKEWVDGAGDPAQGKVILDSLAQLAKGEGWVWYPEGGHLERVKFPTIKTYDSSATPKHGPGGAKEAPAVREIKLDEVRAALAEAVKEAEANDPKLLRAEVALLKGELAKAGKGIERGGTKNAEGGKGFSAADVDAAVQRARREAVAAVAKQFRGIVTDASRIERDLKPVLADLESLRRGIDAFSTLLDGAAKVGPNKESGRAIHPLPSQIVTAVSGPKRTDLGAPKGMLGSGGDIRLPKAERKILEVLAACRIDGEGWATKSKVALLTGYAVGGGGFNNALSALRNCDPEPLIEGTGDRIRATQGGCMVAGDVAPLPSGPEALAGWLQAPALGKAERLILHHLNELGGRASKEKLGEACGYAHDGGGFNNALSRLRTLELITGRGEIELAEVFR